MFTAFFFCSEAYRFSLRPFSIILPLKNSQKFQDRYFMQILFVDEIFQLVDKLVWYFYFILNQWVMVLPLFHQNKDRSHEKDYINPIICGECGGFWTEFQVVGSGLY